MLRIIGADFLIHFRKIVIGEHNQIFLHALVEAPGQAVPFFTYDVPGRKYPLVIVRIIKFQRLSKPQTVLYSRRVPVNRMRLD